MSEPTIIATGLSKRYHLVATTGIGWRRNRRSLAEELVSLGQKFSKKPEGEERFTFWALKDVSFEAYPGDTIGVIGHNGAGKSTLLRLLSRVTRPTSGRAIINGRVGSLLEAGSGFHSELTGRENIFISGAIIGMTRAEVKQKFDEIVDFAGVQEFLDTPVKRFSTGMEVRLAFSVAIHLEPELLLVDEVLSVGDAAFQQKSLEKIRQVGRNGGTVLFVSHNMTTVASICNRALVLDHGRLGYPLSPVAEAIRYYDEVGKQHRAPDELKSDYAAEKATVRLTGFELLDENGFAVDHLTSGAPILMHSLFEAPAGSALKRTQLSILIQTMNGEILTNLNSELAVGKNGSLTCRINKLPLMPGSIRISLYLEDNGRLIQHVPDAYLGQIDRGGHLVKKDLSARDGLVLMDAEWSS
jgi:lipopolysaccharide transport system ATP-binding protein